eukprot:scaffold10267_cov116-Isochrysis_galbana.AAC.6
MATTSHLDAAGGYGPSVGMDMYGIWMRCRTFLACVCTRHKPIAAHSVSNLYGLRVRVKNSGIVYKRFLTSPDPDGLKLKYFCIYNSHQLERKGQHGTLARELCGPSVCVSGP